MTKTVVITQSNYIPWRGYFDLFRQADEVILLDSVQYTRRDWRNRNKIKTPQGPVWLSIPVQVKGKYNQAIYETVVTDDKWADEHWRIISHNYRKAECYESHSQWLHDLVSSAADKSHLTDINEHLLKAICRKLEIDVTFSRCTDLLHTSEMAAMDPTERLAELAQAVGASHYLSGPAAKSYLDPAVFDKKGIGILWMDYSDYPTYPQLWGEFEPAVSIVDLILNTGDRAPEYLLKISPTALEK